MKEYTYRAKTKDGKTAVGKVEASNPQAAAKLVRGRGMTVFSIKPAVGGLIGYFKSQSRKVRPNDIAIFTRQFSTMITAGLPITEGLTILRAQSKVSMQAIIGQILSDVESGDSLSKALEKHHDTFSTTYVALVKSGETGGVMDKVLLRLADNLEKEQEFRGKVQGALVYPAIVVVGMVIVAAIMMIFVIPKLLGLYTDFGAELPLPTKILVSISNLAVKLWPLILALVFLCFWGLKAYAKTQTGKKAIDEITFKIPVFGQLQKEIILAEFTRTLSLMVGAGVSILEGLSVTAGVVKNEVIASAIKDAAKQIEKGFPVAFSFAKHPEAFPFLLSQMVAVGEETGKMEDVLMKVSRIFEIESDQKVKTLTTAIEPAVMIILGVGVGFLVIAVILPIYNLTSQF